MIDKGANQIKESKINIIIHQFELFKTESDVYERYIFSLTNVINGLKSLKKSYPKLDLVNKILRLLQKLQEPKSKRFENSIS